MDQPNAYVIAVKVHPNVSLIDVIQARDSCSLA